MTDRVIMAGELFTRNPKQELPIYIKPVAHDDRVYTGDRGSFADTDKLDAFDGTVEYDGSSSGSEGWV